MAAAVAWDDFTSPAYKLGDSSVASSEMWNQFCAVIEKGPRTGKLMMKGIPGLKTFAVLPDTPLRGLLGIDGGNRLFAVSGGTVYEVYGDGTFAALAGSVALGQHPVTMAANGFEIAIASAGYLFMALGAVPGPGNVVPINFSDNSGPVMAQTVDLLDNYFIANPPNSKQIFISNLAPDGSIWDPGDTAYKEGYADNIARVFCDNEQLWLFGFETTEPWTDTGALFPFQRIQDTVLKIGCTAPWSVSGALGIRFWLFNCVVYSAFGVQPQRVSDSGVEAALKSYGNISDAEGFCYVDGGRLFYVLSIPSAQATWVLDNSLGAWHRRAFYQAGQPGRYRPRVYARAFTMDLVGDYQSGAIYQLDPKTYTDAGGADLVRDRICPYITESNRNLKYPQLQIDMKTGVGLPVNPAQNTPGYNPQLMMRYSDDRGKTFKNWRYASVGIEGEYQRRVIYNQNGASRVGKVFQTRFTEPCEYQVSGAYLKITPPGEQR